MYRHKDPIVRDSRGERGQLVSACIKSFFCGKRARISSLKQKNEKNTNINQTDVRFVHLAHLAGMHQNFNCSALILQFAHGQSIGKGFHATPSREVKISYTFQTHFSDTWSNKSTKLLIIHTAQKAIIRIRIVYNCIPDPPLPFTPSQPRARPGIPLMRL